MTVWDETYILRRRTSSITRTFDLLRIARAIHSNCFSLKSTRHHEKEVQSLVSKILTLWKSYRLLLIQTSPSPRKHWHWPCQTLQQGCLRMRWDGHDEGLHTNINSEYHHRQHQTSWNVTDNLCILILFKYIEGWTKAAAKDGRVLYTSHKPWHKNQVWVNSTHAE